MSDDKPRDTDVLYDETVRDLLGAELEGRTIVGISQQDKDEFVEGLMEVCIMLHLDNGSVLKFWPEWGDVELERADGSYRTIGLTSGDDD